MKRCPSLESAASRWNACILFDLPPRPCKLVL